MPDLTHDWLAERVARLTGLVERMPEMGWVHMGPPNDIEPAADIKARLAEVERTEARERALALLTGECPHWEGSPTGGYCGNIPECVEPYPRDLWADLSLASWPEWVREALVLAWLFLVVEAARIGDISVAEIGSVEAAFGAVERALC